MFLFVFLCSLILNPVSMTGSESTFARLGSPVYKHIEETTADSVWYCAHIDRDVYGRALVAVYADSQHVRATPRILRVAGPWSMIAGVLESGLDWETARSSWCKPDCCFGFVAFPRRGEAPISRLYIDE